jgi:hypothetical protein
MMQIPLYPVPSQTVATNVGGQAATIAVYQKRTGFFFDLALNGAAVITAVLCQNRAMLLTQTYQGFVGSFFFFDTQGDTPPTYAGLGPDQSARYQLVYLSAADLAA